MPRPRFGRGTVKETINLNNKEIVMTYAGLRALEDELEELKTVKRKEVAEKIKVARGYGDLSENSEYDEAKNEQGFVESRIVELEKTLKYARVLDEDELTGETVQIGSYVKIKDEDGEVEEYNITGSTEANPLDGKISNESPVGAALMGKKPNDVVDITLPNGTQIQYTVLEIGRTKL
ncbi:MAG: transcription elongation factor GreA [Oscillospiraceae bacterium]|jgi:transcription elongation factor GreA|nr:transcription elongation factor GreA [Oscillospiraceae bacterium]